MNDEIITQKLSHIKYLGIINNYITNKRKGEFDCRIR